MLRFYALLAIVGVLISGAGSALAENRVALVIGNANYAHTTPLANPRNDANDMTAALKSMSFDVVEAIDKGTSANMKIRAPRPAWRSARLPRVTGADPSCHGGTSRCTPCVREFPPRRRPVFLGSDR